MVHDAGEKTTCSGASVGNAANEPPRQGIDRLGFSVSRRKPFVASLVVLKSEARPKPLTALVR
jgi:hypothetical protein